MMVIVYGPAAEALGEVAAQRRGVRVVAPADPWVALGEDDSRHVIVDVGLAGGAALAGRALAAGRVVLLTALPAADDEAWLALARAGGALTLSRPLRFSRVLATAQAAIRAGQVGPPRALQLRWTFPAEGATARGVGAGMLGGLVDAGVALADAAAWLLAEPAARLYAVRCGLPGAPLLQGNLVTRGGWLALLQATLGVNGHPPRRELSLQAAEGALYHDAHHANLLWSGGAGEVMDDVDDGAAREVVAWLDGAHGDLAGADALRDNLALARAIARSLTEGVVAPVAEEATV